MKTHFSTKILMDEIKVHENKYVFKSTVKLGYKNMLNRGNSGYRGHFAADRFFYLIKTG